MNNIIKSENKNKFKVGDIINLSILTKDSEKQRLQNFDGIVISIKNKEFSKTFKILRIVEGIKIEQTFPLFSPKIYKIEKKGESKKSYKKLYK